MTDTTALAAALERAARALHDAAQALNATQPQPPTARQPQPPTGRTCQCGATVEYREWTSKAGKPCKAYKCTASRQGEDHLIEWVR